MDIWTLGYVGIVNRPIPVSGSQRVLKLKGDKLGPDADPDWAWHGSETLPVYDEQTQTGEKRG